MRYRAYTENDRGRLTRDVLSFSRDAVYRFEIEYNPETGADVFLHRVGSAVKLRCATLPSMGDGFDYLSRIDADADGGGEWLDRLTAHYDAVMLATLTASVDRYDAETDDEPTKPPQDDPQPQPTDQQPRKASGVIARWVQTGRRPATD